MEGVGMGEREAKEIRMRWRGKWREKESGKVVRESRGGEGVHMCDRIQVYTHTRALALCSCLFFSLYRTHTHTNTDTLSRPLLLSLYPCRYPSHSPSTCSSISAFISASFVLFL